MVKQHHLFTATRVRLVLIAAALGVTFGVIDAEVDSLIRTWGTDESYLAQLTAEFLQPELREVWVRSVVLVLFIVLGIYIAFERQRSDSAIARLAYYDPLTSLANRTLLLDRVEHELMQARRQCVETRRIRAPLPATVRPRNAAGHRRRRLHTLAAARAWPRRAAPVPASCGGSGLDRRDRQMGIADGVHRGTEVVSEHLIICVNVSSHEVMGDGFVDNVRSALTHSGLEPGRLEIELNDVVLAEKPDVAWARLKSLREMGVRIAVDGFGLRQSSFAQLARLPVNTLKIDRAFVRDVVHGHREQAIVDLLLALARGLDLVTVAEQLHYLQGQQCDRLQGSSGAAHARAGAHAGAQGR